MQIRCPHCRNPIEIVSDETLGEVDCPGCGSSFSLVPDDETGTRKPGKRPVDNATEEAAKILRIYEANP